MQQGSMYVQWEAPETITEPYPVVLVHGGGSQGSDWLGTIDGKPGWAAHFVAAGFVTYVVDRVGLGRSPFHPDALGAMGLAVPYEGAIAIFAPESYSDTHTAWPYGRTIGTPEIDRIMAALGPLPADLGHSQNMDASRLVELLELIGLSVLVTHSAGSPVGLLVADRSPDNVVAIAQIEPMGPPFVEYEVIGSLEWGLTASPIGYEAEFTSPAEVRAADPSQLTVPGLVDKPIAVYTGTASEFKNFAPLIVDFLKATGAQAEWIDYGTHGVTGNGHGLIFETNAEQTVAPVIEWIRSKTA